MPINIGYIEGTLHDGDFVARIYYDATIPFGEPQPLINGPRGFCLDLTNISGRPRRVVASLPDGTTVQVNVGQGDPVISGPPSGRSRTAAQMRSLGFEFRSDVAGFSID